MSLERSHSQTGDSLNISGISMSPACFRRCIFILDELLSCYDCFQFLAPVSLTAVVYHTEIKQPMDFETLENNLYANKYNDYNEFVQDLSLIWSNAKLFHRSFDFIYLQAENLLKRYSGLEEFLRGGPKPFYLSTSSSDIEFLLSNPLPEEMLDSTQDISVIVEETPEQKLEQAPIQQLNVVLPMYKEIDPPRKTNLYFVQALSEQDNNTKKLRGFSNVRRLFQLLNASFFKYMASPSTRYNSPPLPRFYIAKNRTLLTEVRGDPQGVLAVLCNVQIKPLNKELSRLQATVAIAEPMGETHGFDESSMDKSDEYDFCPKAWSKLRVLQVVNNVNTIINADIDRNFFKKFYNTYKLSAKGPSDLKKVGNDDIAKQFVASLLNPKAGAAPPIPASASRKNGESNYIKIKKENTASAPPQSITTAVEPIVPRKRGRPPKISKKRTPVATTNTITEAPSNDTVATTASNAHTTSTTYGSFNPNIYTSGSPAAAALKSTTSAVAMSPASTSPSATSNATKIRLVLNKIRPPTVKSHEGECDEDAMQIDEQTRTPSTGITASSSQDDVDVPSPAAKNNAIPTRVAKSDPSSSPLNHTTHHLPGSPFNITNGADKLERRARLNDTTTTTATTTTTTTPTTPMSTADDVDVPSGLTVQIPIEVYDDTASSSLVDTNTTTSPTNTYNDTDLDEAAYYEPLTASQEARAIHSPDTTTFSNIYGDDVVKAHWKKLIDYADAKNVPIVDIKTYELEDSHKHNAEGYFKRVYFLKSDPHKVLQTFRRMTITQRTTEVVSLLALKGLPHIGQITEVLVKDKENGDYEVLGLTMQRYQKTLKHYAHPHSHHRLTAHQKMDLVQQMLECMETIHQVGLAHRDLSEVNFMVDATTEKLADGSVKANLILIDFGKSVFTKPEQIRRWWIEHPRREEYDGEIVPLTKQELEKWCQHLPWIRSKPDHGYRLYRSIQTLPKNRTDTQDLPWLVDPVAEDMYSTGTLVWKIFSETEPWYGILDTDLKGLRETVGDDYHIEKALERQVSGRLSKDLLLQMIKVTPDQRSTARQVMNWIMMRQQALLEEWVVNAPVERKKRHAKRYDDEDDEADPSSPLPPPNGNNKKQKRHHPTHTVHHTNTNSTIPPLKLRF